MNAKYSNTQLEELVHKLAWNDAFGCYTRSGFEKMIWPDIVATARWIVYFDIDGMHALNDTFGDYGPVDAMIKQVLSVVRATDYVAGQWKSGDEFLVCVTENDERKGIEPHGLMTRLIDELKKHGMSATFAIVPVNSMDLTENVKPAVNQVYATKKARGVSR